MTAPTDATAPTPLNQSTQPIPPDECASYYQRHVFFCLNQRDDGRECCQAKGAQAAQEHAKETHQTTGYEWRGPGSDQQGWLP